MNDFSFDNKYFYFLIFLFVLGSSLSICVLYFDSLFLGKGSSYQFLNLDSANAKQVNNINIQDTAAKRLFSESNGKYVEVSDSLEYPSANLSKKYLGSIKFLKVYPKVAVWLLLYIILFTYFTINIPVVWGVIIYTIKKYKVNKKAIVYNIIFTLAIIGLMLVPTLVFYDEQLINDDNYPLMNIQNKLWVIMSIGYILFGTCLFAMLILVSCSERIVLNDRKDIKKFLELKSILQFYLIIIGLQMTIGVLTSASNLSSYVEYYPQSSTDFTKDASKMYALYHTIFIAAVYIPVFLSLYFKGVKLKNTLNPIPEEIDKLSEWEKNENELDNILKLTSSIKGSVEIALPLLVPIISSYMIPILNVKI